jgi:hypothetical protein
MSKWTSVVLTGLACCLTLPALSLETALGCPPPPPLTQDAIKKTAEVEVRGRLEALLLRCGPGSKAWIVIAEGKSYILQFATAELLTTAEALDGKDVALTGALDNGTLTVQTLKAAAE